jgi:uncharacterized repeat protein (TIGR03803 family)
VVYSFEGYSEDGSYPVAGLLNINGTLFGTTESGGSGACGNKNRALEKPIFGCGTVFEITTSGAESVLHSFSPNGDGAGPEADLVEVHGTLYGTTEGGGVKSDGTVFSITPSGAETVLHSFGASSDDGISPLAGLTNVNGTLYGTTNLGGTSCRSGADGCGTVFSITTSGTETVLHSFGGSTDGDYPVAGLINVSGMLYGTTAGGGANDAPGTVFSITPSGKETVLHDFESSSDGVHPEAPLLEVNGAFYGTTERGGYYGDGTVFSVTPSGAETVLHNFGGSGDGAYPRAGLINVKGTLYGTTPYGGLKCNKKHTCGTVFSITTSGTEAVLYRFKGHSNGRKDGAQPQAPLINVNGTLYGTTYGGGANGAGTVLALSP